MRLNTRTASEKIFTHEGGPAHRESLDPRKQLRRSVLACMLFEDEFYEAGSGIADRIYQLALTRPADEVAALAREARGVFNLRHVPLVLLAALSVTGKGTSIVADAVRDVIQRPDEAGELIQVIGRFKGVKDAGKQAKKLQTHGVRRGLAMAMGKFDNYQLAKYDRPADIRLRDIYCLTHPSSQKGSASSGLVGDLVNREKLPSPDTWEVALSGGANKKEAFERLIMEGRLPYLALLRNLRNMVQAGVEHDIVRYAILARKGARRVLPFRYIAAARAAPMYEPALDEAMQAAVAEMEPLEGETYIVVDVSGSMDAPLSAKSDLTRMDAAAALAVLWPGRKRVFTFSQRAVEVPPRAGMAGIEAVVSSQTHGQTMLGAALRVINPPEDVRLIVITDEQSHDGVPQPRAGSRAYLINVASNQHGVGYGNWIHLTGFSEHVIRWIIENEKEENMDRQPDPRPKDRPTLANLRRPRVNVDAPHGKGDPGSTGYFSR